MADDVRLKDSAAISPIDATLSSLEYRSLSLSAFCQAVLHGAEADGSIQQGLDLPMDLTDMNRLIGSGYNLANRLADCASA